MRMICASILLLLVGVVGYAQACPSCGQPMVVHQQQVQQFRQVQQFQQVQQIQAVQQYAYVPVALAPVAAYPMAARAPRCRQPIALPHPLQNLRARRAQPAMAMPCVQQVAFVQPAMGFNAGETSCQSGGFSTSQSANPNQLSRPALPFDPAYPQAPSTASGTATSSGGGSAEVNAKAGNGNGPTPMAPNPQKYVDPPGPSQ